MKTRLLITLLLIVACLEPGRSLAVEMRLATVDTSRALRDFHKTHEADRATKSRIESAKAALQPKIEARQKLGSELDKLALAAKDTTLSEAARLEAKTAFAQRYPEFQKLTLDLQQEEAKRRAEIESEMTQARKGLLDETLTMARRIAKAQGFNLLLDSSAAQMVVLDASPEVATDITALVLAELNKGAPAAATAAR